jgi:predicted nucleic acid-binding protein
MRRYMLDTNVFNAVMKGGLAPEIFLGAAVFATHIQRDELNDTPDPATKAALVAVFQSIDADQVSTSSAVWDVSSWDDSEWDDDDDLHSQLVAAVKAADKAKGKKPKGANQNRDALIAHTAIRKNLTLLTGDGGLAQAVRDHGGQAMSLDEFLASRDVSSGQRE